ncbi:MAG: germination protein YpeB [Oscillospiraceae bacterium]|nr:germination protein YpeB [Oscillospiraceae bacterium]
MTEKGISHRGKIRLISYITFALAALTVFSVVQSVKVARYEREILLTRQRALISLDEYLSDITSDLQKVVYVSTPSMVSNLSTKLWRDCAEAKNSLAQLPSNDSSISNTYGFLSQVGEYIMSIQRKSMRGEELTEDERKQLLELCEFANSLSEKLNSMCYSLQNGTFTFEKKSNMFLSTNEVSDTVFEKMDDVEQTLSDVPSLVFDGPFSNHIENMKPKLLEGEEEINKNQAQEIANNVCGDGKELTFAFEESGNVPCYVFKNDDCTVAVTKQGGYPLYMLNSTFAGEINIEYEDAVNKAKEYLNSIGYKNMKESYYFTDDGICTVNFAYVQGDAICYADLIKVSVNLHSGEIHSFDATGYVSCHTKRTVPENAITAEEGRKKLYSGLEISNVSACFAPTEWKSENYCYEYLCTTENGQQLLVYLNAATGEEENVLILLYSDGGVLTK